MQVAVIAAGVAAFMAIEHHASLDVFPQEPIPGESAYRKLDNVTLTAHAAYMTDDAHEELWRRTLAGLDASATASPGPSNLSQRRGGGPNLARS
ncbi:MULTISPECIES: hypothetical protein [unclassified Mesorhizobium]|uniref:hypothetical protein n=1 Tax=unclassified Mesorhizobium TaxID=325217 RepID=UPI000FCCBFA5|nr:MULTISPECIES: hypothetical protein [unclassified Mesorhizobium]RUW36210.1 hypothetical protein EOA38_06545 [Mesorhizobium sp. M1E.F.Ca.ET.041.01.1.1]RWD89891.1 MAG: hypothetical protein EOS38_10275 [Mesorhizobium sp.]RWD93494.1 MAG: hypothetical protein EOS39_11730 [Mesorhizobium sp.]TIU35710.1 MAG: hypothetical protein E5W38_00620 [Mesorhizobium sp.]TIV55066.1 MAG: hypothetical protein E5V88_03050 [Mesorhizobium sp.]